MHADQKLYLVFEFLDVDLKRYIETGNQNRTPITLQIVKVSLLPTPPYLRVMYAMVPVKTRHGNAFGRETPYHCCKDSSEGLLLCPPCPLLSSPSLSLSQAVWQLLTLPIIREKHANDITTT